MPVAHAPWSISNRAPGVAVWTLESAAVPVACLGPVDDAACVVGGDGLGEPMAHIENECVGFAVGAAVGVVRQRCAKARCRDNFHRRRHPCARGWRGNGEKTSGKRRETVGNGWNRLEPAGHSAAFRSPSLTVAHRRSPSLTVAQRRSPSPAHNVALPFSRCYSPFFCSPLFRSLLTPRLFFLSPPRRPFSRLSRLSLSPPASSRR